MLSNASINAILKDVSYKPGWTFTAYEADHDGPHILITTRQLDAYHPNQTIDLGIRSALPPIPDEAYLHAWLIWRIGIIEAHEVREWYKVDCLPHSDPHAVEHQALR